MPTTSVRAALQKLQPTVYVSLLFTLLIATDAPTEERLSFSCSVLALEAAEDLRSWNQADSLKEAFLMVAQNIDNPDFPRDLTDVTFENAYRLPKLTAVLCVDASFPASEKQEFFAKIGDVTVGKHSYDSVSCSDRAKKEYSKIFLSADRAISSSVPIFITFDAKDYGEGYIQAVTSYSGNFEQRGFIHFHTNILNHMPMLNKGVAMNMFANERRENRCLCVRDINGKECIK